MRVRLVCQDCYITNVGELNSPPVPKGGVYFGLAYKSLKLPFWMNQEQVLEHLTVSCSVFFSLSSVQRRNYSCPYQLKVLCQRLPALSLGYTWEIKRKLGEVTLLPFLRSRGFQPVCPFFKKIVVESIPYVFFNPYCPLPAYPCFPAQAPIFVSISYGYRHAHKTFG